MSGRTTDYLRVAQRAYGNASRGGDASHAGVRRAMRCNSGYGNIGSFANDHGMITPIAIREQPLRLEARVRSKMCWSGQWNGAIHDQSSWPRI
jgi:hypothetical protein